MEDVNIHTVIKSTEMINNIEISEQAQIKDPANRVHRRSRRKCRKQRLKSKKIKQLLKEKPLSKQKRIETTPVDNQITSYTFSKTSKKRKRTQTITKSISSTSISQANLKNFKLDNKFYKSIQNASDPVKEIYSNKYYRLVNYR